MRLFRMMLLVVISASFAPSAFGQTNITAADVVRKTLANYKRMSGNLRSLHLETIERKRNGVTRTTVAGVKPNKMRLENIESGAPPDYAFVSDGETLWLYARRANRYMKQPASEANAVLMEFYSNRVSGVIKHFEQQILPAVFSYLDKAVIEIANNATSFREENVRMGQQSVICYVIESRVTSNDHLLPLTLWVDKNKLLLHHLELVVDHPNMAAPVMVTLAINEELPPDLFRFSPPSGATRVKTAEQFMARPFDRR